MWFLIIVFIVFGRCWAFADGESCQNLQSIRLVKSVLQTDKYYLNSEFDKHTFDQIYPHMRQCPSEYLNLELTASERENLKKIFSQRELDGYATYILDNLAFIDLDEEIKEYKKFHSLVYGTNKSIDPDMQKIVSNQKSFLEDKKALCSTSEVDTTYMGPVRDQKDTNWCYAYAAADLLSFHAKKRYQHWMSQFYLITFLKEM